jgi:hypothetical protein
MRRRPVLAYETPWHVGAAVVTNITKWLLPGYGQAPITRLVLPSQHARLRRLRRYAEAGSGELWLVEVKQVLIIVLTFY